MISIFCLLYKMTKSFLQKSDCKRLWKNKNLFGSEPAKFYLTGIKKYQINYRRGFKTIENKLLGRSKGAKPFSVSGRVTSSLLTPTVLSSRVETRDRDEIRCGARTKDDFKFLENKYGLNLPFPE